MSPSNWRPFILNYFEYPVTNAYTQSLNNLIRVMNRLGRGYSFEGWRAKILFTEGAHSNTDRIHRGWQDLDFANINIRIHRNKSQVKRPQIAGVYLGVQFVQV